MKNARFVLLTFAAAVLALAMAPAMPTSAATFTVNSTLDTDDATPEGNCDSDPGAPVVCTLREAIREANFVAGGDIIGFNIAGAGPHTINVGSIPAGGLPQITQAVTIDGTTEPSFAGSPVVELNGAGAGAGVSGLNMTATATVKGLVINRFTSAGILTNASGSIIQGNYIGTDATGTVTTGFGNGGNGVQLSGGPSGILIGGGTSATRNVISGNTLDGISINGAGHQVSGNYIGTDVTGVQDRGNLDEGLTINGGNTHCVGGNIVASVCTATAGFGNVISGNDGNGIEILSSAGNSFYGNLIGTQVDGVSARGNGSNGLGGAVANSIIGGTAANQPNTIAFSGQDGVLLILASATGNSIRGNRIHSNGQVGIDLASNNVSPNDPAPDSDTGPNNLQNFPVLSAAWRLGANTVVEGSLTSALGTTYNLDFYSNATCDASGNGEGATYIGSTTATTDAGTGVASFNVTLAASVNVGEVVTATATRNGAPLDTSEFSACRAVTNIIVNSNVDPGAGGCTVSECTLREAITAANGAASTDTIHFNIPGVGPHTIAPATPLPTITQPLTIDGYTQPGSSANTNPISAGSNAVLRIELNGTNAPAGARGLFINGGGSTVRGLVINRFLTGSIELTTLGDNVVEGNFLGTDASGTVGLSNPGNAVSVLNGSANNVIGGTSAAARNVLSAHLRGVLLVGDGNTIAGNFIGTDASGTADLGNGTGVLLSSTTDNSCIGGVFVAAVCTPSTPARNVISGNGNGIEMTGTTPPPADNKVLGNFIGTQRDGLTALANSANGIRIGSANNSTIGGTDTVRQNLIAFNTQAGVLVFGGTGNAVRGNRVHSNTGLGIDVGIAGVTANDAGDADAGANNLQNFPVLTSASTTAGHTAVVGTLNSTASTVFNVDFYHSASCDGTGNGEGELHLGSTQVTTDAGGNATINATLEGAVTPGRAVTSTATRNAAPLDTSEYSNCVSATGSTSWFRPSSTTTLSSAALSANPNTTTTFDIPLPDALPSNGHADAPDFFPPFGTGFTDGSFTIANDAAITNGATVGSAQFVGRFGLSNGACSSDIVVAISSLRDADTSISDTIAPAGPPGNPVANLVADNRGANLADPPNGLPDYLDATPTFNNTIFSAAGGGPLVPLARYAGHVLVASTRDVILQIVVFNPGDLSVIPNGGWLVDDLGYPTLAVMGDPTAGPVNNPIGVSDACSPLTSSVTLCGKADPAGASGCPTGGGTQPRLTSPAATRTVQATVQAKSLRDNDNDGIENQLDPCPNTNSSGWDPRSGSGAGDPDLDGLPSDCDPAPAVASADQDGDGRQNRIDNCPLVANAAGQLDQDIASNASIQDGGPRSDGIGAACDGSSLPNGHYHRTAVVYRNCVTANAAVDDTDGDGVCETGPAGALIDPNDSNTDSDGDGAGDRTDNCPSTANPPPAGFTQTDYDLDGMGDPCDLDLDGDGWTNPGESTIGTDAGDPCPENSSDNAWPPDLNNDGFIDISDVVFLTGEFGSTVPPSPARHDIAPDANDVPPGPDGFIDITDIVQVTGLFGQGCGTLYGTTTGPP